MAKAKGTFHIFDPEQGVNIVVEKDSEIPEHLLSQVGNHLGGTRESAEAPGADPGAPVPTEGTEEYDAAIDEAYSRGVADAREAETEAYAAEGYGEFDPSADGVNAGVVKDYLTGLSRETVAGAREFDRVTDAEKAGGNRSTALVD